MIVPFDFIYLSLYLKLKMQNMWNIYIFLIKNIMYNQVYLFYHLQSSVIIQEKWESSK